MFKPVDPNVNFPEMERKWLKRWYKKGVVKKYLLKNSKSSKTFSFLDGPITANNPMGVHHAWGRTYKDLWPKFYNLLGYRQRFQNGFDCQGLWVEVEVEKELGLKGKKEIENLVTGDPTSLASLGASRKASIAKFVELCKQRVYKYSKIQTEQSKRLGYFADWDNSYYTMSDENNYMIWHFLKRCYENGWIYKGKDSVPWCPRCETAISEHEILTENYKVVGHESVYFLLQLVETHSNASLQNAKTYLLVWTTTPWTIPANIAVAVDEKIDYSLVKTEEGNVWLAKDTIKRVIKSKVHQVLKMVKGKELVGLKYEGPFDNLPAVKKVAEKNPRTFHTVILTDQRTLPITVTEGTGMVHTAVSAGTEDFKLGKKLGLPMIPVIADNADYLPNLGFLSGKNAKKNPRLILDYLEEKGFAYEIFNYKHRYPACWRCRTELVWKVEDEWYIAMDKIPNSLPRRQAGKFQVTNKSQITNSKNKKTLRQRMIKVAKKIRWMPEFGLDRELDWLKNMHDWLISKKNRYWGLALPIYECKKCLNFEVIGSREELKQRAIMGWKSFEGHTPHKPHIDEVIIECKKCGNEVKRINDVGNPWLDAGIVGYSTITENNQGEPLYLKNKKEWEKWFPADFITESFPGQFKNWFYALIAESSVLENTTQFKTVLGFGTLLGEDGRAMHKSWGNMIEFLEGADKIGVDVMRWMFSRQNPSDNMLFGYKKADEVRRQFYLMFWNVYKFFVEYANLDKWTARVIPSEARNLANEVSVNNMHYASLDFSVASLLRNDKKGSKNILDKWILSKFSRLILFVEKSLKDYNAKDAALEIEKFVSDLSTWYLRRSRDRVWVNSEDKDDKNNLYKTLHYVLVNLSVILSPFMPFVTEEIYTNLTTDGSVHLVSWPEVNKNLIDQALEIQMELGRKIVEVGNSLRKERNLKLRQPLLLAWHNEPKEKINSTDILHQVLRELNIKSWIHEDKFEIFVKKKGVVSKEINGFTIWIDTSITDDLRKEGEIRDLIRKIQSLRKQLGTKPDQTVNLILPQELMKYADAIKKKVMAKKIAVGDELKVQI